MDAAERDSTEDWLLPAGSAPPLLRELEQKVDVALAIARSSEQAVSKVGDAALEAAQQARRAAELAETASAAALEASRAVAGSAPVAAEPAPEDTAVWAVPEPPPADPDASLRRFSEHADRVAARLRALEPAA